jgi:arginine decarboxylase
MTRSVVNSELPILKATGTGGTALAAFHNALVGVNLAHYNLIRLSSVIPPGTIIDPTGTAPAPTGSWGDRLYCVYAEQRTTTPGEEAWAGIGWVQRLSGGGLMVEHEGGSEAFVTDSILTTLYDMVQGCEADFAPPHFVVNGAHCTSKPVCSLVIAPFEMAPWHVGAPVPADLDVSRGSRPRHASAPARVLSPSRT